MDVPDPVSEPLVERVVGRRDAFHSPRDVVSLHVHNRDRAVRGLLMPDGMASNAELPPRRLVLLAARAGHLLHPVKVSLLLARQNRNHKCHTRHEALLSRGSGVSLTAQTAADEGVLTRTPVSRQAAGSGDAP